VLILIMLMPISFVLIVLVMQSTDSHGCNPASGGHNHVEDEEECLFDFAYADPECDSSSTTTTIPSSLSSPASSPKDEDSSC